MTTTQQQSVWSRWLPEHRPIGDEEVIYFLRRHPFVLLSKYGVMLLLALLPIVLYFFFVQTFPSAFTPADHRNLLYTFASIYYLFLWIICFAIFIDYYLDIWVVTTHRIIDREQHGLFNVRISEQSLEHVQDVSAHVEGVVPTLLNYGDVLVQTAAHQNLFEFRQIPGPENVAREINRLAEEFVLHHEHAKTDREPDSLNEASEGSPSSGQSPHQP